MGFHSNKLLPDEGFLMPSSWDKLTQEISFIDNLLLKNSVAEYFPLREKVLFDFLVIRSYWLLASTRSTSSKCVKKLKLINEERQKVVNSLEPYPCEFCSLITERLKKEIEKKR